MNLRVKVQPHSGAVQKGYETPQAAIWNGEFGREYTDRNTFDTEALNELCRRNYGITRREINDKFLGGVGKKASILEVGCNTGNQLLLLREMGYSNLSGVELQPYALEIARRRLPGASLDQGSALALPHPDSSFDLVFTSGVLIHIAPDDLPAAMDEIHRCAKTYIWGVEYFAPAAVEVNYRGHSALLWKTDFAQRFLERFDDLKLVLEQRLPYLENANIDTAFLLRKNTELSEGD